MKLPKSKKCPKCGKVKLLSKFGTRTPKGKSEIPQSYCITCRGSHPLKIERSLSKKKSKKSKKQHLSKSEKSNRE